MEKRKAGHTLLQKFLAWGVHLFTASGVVFALLAIIAISQHDFHGCMVWLLVAFLVDGFDGMLARKFKVREVLPHIQGKNIDFVIDFATYAIIPAYFLYEAHWLVDGLKVGVLPDAEWVKMLALSILLLTSALYYGKEPMVSEDMHFVGFPVMWNAVAYFTYFVVQPAPWVTFGLIILFSILHFVPLKYAYPSQNQRFKILNWMASLFFIIVNTYLLCVYPDVGLELRIAAGAVLPYLLWHTLWVSFR